MKYIYAWVLLACIVLVLGVGNTARSEADHATSTPAVAQEEQKPKAWTEEELRAYAIEVAEEYNLKTDRFLEVIRCESQWNPNAEGDFRNGVPTSFGLAQFHKPQSGWGISIEEAKDPSVALPLMAQAWVDGYAHHWTCWRIKYG